MSTVRKRRIYTCPILVFKNNFLNSPFITLYPFDLEIDEKYSFDEKPHIVTAIRNAT
jgi:hypothetical protein